VKIVTTSDNLTFQLKPIDTVAIKPGEGAKIRISMAIIQRTTALRAYNSYSEAKDWMQKLSAAFVVALATRSADLLLMKSIQNGINLDPPIDCNRCREATIGVNVIREKIFPRLKELREHANALIHHLDDPNNMGIDSLNIQGVFEYCYYLFQTRAESLFGTIPESSLPFTKCKQCKKKSAK